MEKRTRRRKAEPVVWNLARAVHWMKTVSPVKPDAEPEELDPEYQSDSFAFADGLEADVDPEDGRLARFLFTVKPSEERAESFGVDMPWGRCHIEGTPADDELVWTCEPPLADDGASEALAQEFQDLMDRRYRPAWTDPCTGWCPEAADDLPCGWIDCALDNLMADARLYVGKERKGGDEGLYVVRNEADLTRLSESLDNLRELSLDEAAAFVDEHYDDCFDWPDSPDGTASEGPAGPSLPTDHYLRLAVNACRGQTGWRGAYESVRKSRRRYLMMRAWEVLNPDRAQACGEVWRRALKTAAARWREKDWRTLGENLPPGDVPGLPSAEECRAYLRAIEAARRAEAEAAAVMAAEREAWDARVAELRAQFTPDDVLARFDSCYARWKAGALSSEEYDAEMEQVRELEEAVCWNSVPGARRVRRALDAEWLQRAFEVHGV